MDNCYIFRLQYENEKLHEVIKILKICLNTGFSLDCNYCDRNDNCPDVNNCPIIDELMQKVKELDGDNNECD